MKPIVLISSLLLSLSSVTTFAQGPGPGGPPPKDPIAEALDTNKDGVISEAEMKKASETLATLDQNEDGALDRDELRPPSPPAAEVNDGKRSRRSNRNSQREERRRPASPLAQALDRNGNGEISSQELRRAKRVLKRLDRNRDDQLSGEELHPRRPAGGPPQGQGPQR